MCLRMDKKTLLKNSNCKFLRIGSLTLCFDVKLRSFFFCSMLRQQLRFQKKKIPGQKKKKEKRKRKMNNIVPKRLDFTKKGEVHV